MVIDKDLEDYDFTLKNAKNVSVLKAVTQNLMHANLSITDGVYGILSQVDVREKIARLGQSIGLENNQNIEVLSALIKQLELMFASHK